MDRLAKGVLAPLVLRLALAVVFIVHGMPKADPGGTWGTKWGEGMGLAPALSAAIAWGEVLGGVALAIGFLTRLASLGLIGIMAGAIYTVHGQHGFLMKQADPNSVGYEYNFVLISMLLAVLFLGSGALGLDYWLFRKAPPSAPR